MNHVVLSIFSSKYLLSNCCIENCNKGLSLTRIFSTRQNISAQFINRRHFLISTCLYNFGILVAMRSKSNGAPAQMTESQHISKDPIFFGELENAPTRKTAERFPNTNVTCFQYLGSKTPWTPLITPTTLPRYSRKHCWLGEKRS